MTRLVVAVAVLTSVVSAALAQPAVQPGERRMEIDQKAVVRYAPPWTPSAVEYRNARELVIKGPDGQQSQARVLMTVEPRTSNEDAVQRLAEIAASRPEPAHFLDIGGWPAVEIVFEQPLPRRGQEREDGKEEIEGPPPQHQNAIVACAVENTVVRFDISLAPRAPQGALQSALAIARSTLFASRQEPQAVAKTLERLQTITDRNKATQENSVAPPPPRSEEPNASLSAMGAAGAAAASTGAPVRVQGGVGELEIVASANGTNVVLASNGGMSFSSNRGNTWAGGTTGVFGLNDPSLARAQSGSFYLGVIAFPNGSAAHLNVTGCTNAVSRSTNNGASFTLSGYSARCPQSGAGICFPDQEHIAADPFNAATGGDQLYAVWRNFTPAGTATSCGAIGSGFVTPSITCSQNNGVTWTGTAAIAGAGDFPRVATGRDGTVYVVSLSGNSVILNRFSSCSAGLAAAAGYPRTIATLTGAVACAVPGLDRCNDGNTLASPTISTDPNDANHLFVSFAERDGMGGERVRVIESTNRGDAFSAPVTVSGGNSARRFLPWSCATNGMAFVGWYDRSAATGSANDRTDYFLAGVRSRLWNITNNPDPQCASGWPCSVRSAADSDSCSAQPQLAGRCVNAMGGGSGTACDFNIGGCPSGESCQGGSGCPKYGDYNGVACAGNYVYAAWSSAVPPAGVAGAAGLNVYASRIYIGNDGASIWRSTGTACSGDSCPGWQMLDNNGKTVGIAAATGRLYQLHNDGMIWRYTGTACEDGGACPGWQRLDRNPKTTAIAANDSDLFQLHDDGMIWRSTGTPCTGDSCPGWQRLDRNPATVAISAAGSNLYQLHNNGRIWRYTGTPCSGDSCPGWSMLDNNPKTIAIASGGSELYQLHNDGMIWRYTGTACSGDSCPGWQRLDRNAKTVAIAAAGGALYQLHNDGMIWRYTGTPCSGDSCPGWSRLDRNPKTIAIAAAGSQLYQMHNDGALWRWTGTACTGDSCPGWSRLDNNSRTGMVSAGNDLFQLHTDPLYQRHSGGAIWRYTGTPCFGASCRGWAMLDNNANTREIVAAGSQLFQRHADGKIWRASGTPCTNATTCPGWQMIDNNPATVSIVAAGNQLYQRHNTGAIWRWTGAPCASATSCPGWQMIDNNPRTTTIAAAGNQLFQLHNDGKIWRHTGKPCTSATSCPGWQMLDANPRTTSILATGNQLFQRHNDGKIWRYTGTPCTSATSCPGWQMLDANPATASIAGAGNQLFQIHADGKIWRYTGTPCASATSCPGWQMLDNNGHTRQITGSGTHLYQRHDTGDIWRYTGTPCASATSCPGWQRLDNNASTAAIVAGGFN